MAMVMVRANTLLLRGTWLKQPKWIPFMDGAALEGFPGLHELCGAPVPSAGWQLTTDVCQIKTWRTRLKRQRPGVQSADPHFMMFDETYVL